VTPYAQGRERLHIIAAASPASMPEAQDGFRVVRQVCRKAPTPWRVGVFSHSKSSSKIGHCTAETTKCAPCAMSGLSHAPSTSLTSLTALSTSLGCCFQRFRQLCEGASSSSKKRRRAWGRPLLAHALRTMKMPGIQGLAPNAVAAPHLRTHPRPAVRAAPGLVSAARTPSCSCVLLPRWYRLA